MFTPALRPASLFVRLLPLLAVLPSSGVAAARDWILLTKCEYVTNDNNDGDSFIVRSGNKEFNLRLYNVDAPETDMSQPERTREQSQHFGITLDATLAAGAKARERTRELLRAPFNVRTRWAIAPGRGALPRHYAIVEIDGRSLAEILVSEGLARTKGVAPAQPDGEKAGAYVARLRAMEEEARTKRLGAWAASPP